MPLIRYEASNFGSHWGSALTGGHDLQVPWPELVWGAVTLGKPGLAYLLTHGWHSISDVIVRSHTIYANLRQADNRFEKSSLYLEHDPTEKGAASYFMGMVATKILCARLLDTPWLLHLSMFQASGNTVLLRGRSQPDLVGVDRKGNWTVAEAKGRSNGFSAVAMEKAKRQTRQVRRINGAPPNVCVAVQAHFSPHLSFAIADPEEPDDDPFDLELNEDAAIRQYYSYPLQASRGASRREMIMNREFNLLDIDEVGVSIGLSTDIQQLLEGDAPITFGSLRERAPLETLVREEGSVYFADGIAVRLNQQWSEERMTHDPFKRNGG